MKHVIVAGYGMVAARFAEAVRERDPDGLRVRLTVVGAEPYAAYNRVLLSGALADPEIPIDLHEPGWGKANQVDVRTGTRVVSIDRAARTVRLDDGARLAYDALVLATGSTAWLPPVPGLAGTDGHPAEGVSALRDRDDLARVRSLCRPGTHVAVLGGGVLGLEAARGLVRRGCPVTVVHPAPHLMERQLDPGAGQILLETLESSRPSDGPGHTGATPVTGTTRLSIRTGVGAAAWRPGEGLELTDGTTLACDAVLVSAGTRPRTGLAGDAGLLVRQGVLVDDRLATSDPDIFAIGDCAEHDGAVTGLIEPGWAQADTLADLLTGADPAARYTGARPVTRLKAPGIDLAVVGTLTAPAVPAAAAPDVLEELRLEDASRGRYARVALHEGRVVGAIMLGFPDAAATAIRLYDSGDPAPADRLALLLGRALPPESPVMGPDTVVCRCNTVTAGRLADAYRGGACSVPELARATRATTGCGGCHDAVTALVNALATEDVMEGAA